jgi:hypothetical protein
MRKNETVFAGWAPTSNRHRSKTDVPENKRLNSA